MDKGLKVADYLYWSVGKAKHAKKLLKTTQKGENVVLNFKNVRMVSQDFATEVLAIANKRKLTLTFENACDNIYHMFDYVA